MIGFILGVITTIGTLYFIGTRIRRADPNKLGVRELVVTSLSQPDEDQE